MNFYSSLLYFYSPRNLEEELEEVESQLVILSLSLSLSLYRLIGRTTKGHAAKFRDANGL